MGVATLNLTITFTTVDCANCHMDFAVTRAFDKARRDDHKTFYCPNGHSNYYPQKSDEEKLRDQLENAQRRAIRAENSRDSARRLAEFERRSAIAYRGHLTRMRNKIANGVCPVAGCRRHFDNVQDHIRGVHAAWLEQHEIELDKIGSAAP